MERKKYTAEFKREAVRLASQAGVARTKVAQELGLNVTMLTRWVRDALRAGGGSASLLDVAKRIWKHHESDLRGSGDLFFTWQYDMRWAANRLRRQGTMKPANVSPSGIWELAKG